METYTIQNNNITLFCTVYGAAVTSLYVKDKKGNNTNVVVGFKTVEDYKNHGYCLGASLGRYAGRIGSGYFEIDNQKFPIYTDENGVHLHGGRNGFHKRVWEVETQTETSITFKIESEDGDEGYPGNLVARVTYALEGNKVKNIYTATSDAKTIINLTNHNYYNLNGEGTVLNHELFINSDTFLEVTDTQIATGKLLDVTNTPFDFRTPKIIKEQEGFTGVDDCFPIKSEEAATLYSPKTGIEMKVTTNQPGVVIFTPEDLGECNYKDDAEYSNYSSICFETQNFPNAPHIESFPSAILEAGKEYKNESTFEFSVR
ncbi:aldose epimerase family protein [Neptunitalea lumnitzerae]|uniref:Aldose 1-epimerase n=1 Tax=Neptunitalea lumnitzerae TaxID=2965509 RepID=A0ABQ5MPA3_9FLAO|nr:aldose epimerase family protein [Neptunitalea sp. Y10]GLB50817.1 aldose 1-epimerase [Neptunitalea sp. Y10]